MNSSIWKNLPMKISPALRNSSSEFAKKQSGTETILAACAERTALSERPRARAIRRATRLCLLRIGDLCLTTSVSELKVGAIINTSSGSYDSESEQKMLSILKRAGVVEPRIWCGGGGHQGPPFSDARRHKRGRRIVICGGRAPLRPAQRRARKRTPPVTPSRGKL